MQGPILAGRYHIIKHLGGGSFGQTYLAEDKRRSGNFRCVVKQLKPESTDPQTLEIARRLFTTETESLHNLGTHPQIPELLDHFEENQEFYLVQELIEGRDLSKEITPGQRLSELQVMAILQEILEILVFVQQHKVIHRDIKPSNLMRRNSDRKIFLIDFGAVKRISTHIVNTTGSNPPTIGIGTNGYMPAEQNNGHPNFGSDIYAVGMTGIEWLTGILPHELPKDANCEIVWRDRAQVSDGFANILNKMVRYHFRDRYQSAAEVLQALNNLRRIRPPDRKIVFAGLCLATIFCVAGLLTVILKPADNLATYDNTAQGIKIKYPDNWDKQEESNPITKEVVQFISPKESDADKFQERLIVTVEPTTNKTLDEYTKLSKQEILKLDKNAKIAQEGASTLAGKNGYKVVYTTKDGNRELKKLNVWTMKHDKAYLITYEAEAGKYDQFLPVVEKMIKSLEVQQTK
ncbi:MAG: serine/threonine protein kinase [Oscillatoriales cyanobacterium]|uniref:non-specific serine/threonine protein kinase n=1 Tax=Microcoleus anatoxicus PTRS2 TaxID=2705321 RepID=A0ABU8YWA8_9CYAN|nr:MAG: serine/threonine protein kinase [Oscillatoriales cyanobacterium]TAE03071.1 MAG: serine/threonine protein kinase [Oscillatoriales cyanobacterium]